MNCREALQLMYDYLDSELTKDQVEKVKVHLMVCEHCFSKFEFEKLLHNCLQKKGQVSVNAEPLKSRVMEKIQQLDEEDDRGVFFSRVRPFLAAAAVIVLVVVGLAFVLDSGHSTAYAKVKPLVENHRQCLLDRQSGSQPLMTTDEIRVCLSELMAVPDVLLQPASDRQPTVGRIVTCQSCKVVLLAYDYEGAEITLHIFDDKEYAPPEEFEKVAADHH
ncbi:MAG: zf-HC2 domain-containing protein, partial [candidate division Zixibacteria bacterium]|nr:zf-HC2 domain-containing protein [candidate division Zixibacteria bacterium]